MTVQVPEDTRRIPGPGTATVLLLIVAVLFVFGGLPLQLFFGEVGLLLAQAAFILLPVVILVRKGGFDPVDTLSLRIPSSSQVVGGVLLLAGVSNWR